MKGNLSFNWERSQFNMSNGNPVFINDKESVQAWVEQYIRVERGIYDLYSTNYGVNKYGILQARLPAATALSEINRQVQDSKDQNPYIETISDVTIDDDKNIVFTLKIKEET